MKQDINNSKYVRVRFKTILELLLHAVEHQVLLIICRKKPVERKK